MLDAVVLSHTLQQQPVRIHERHSRASSIGNVLHEGQKRAQRFEPGLLEATMSPEPSFSRRGADVIGGWYVPLREHSKRQIMNHHTVTSDNTASSDESSSTLRKLSM